MRLLSASALWWLLLGAVIIFFYLLKLKRKRRVVSSVFLWQRALEEIEANAPFRRLRRNLLLLLQLLALAAIVFALARPLINTRALTTGSTVIVIDATASMGARDEDSASRLDRAKEMARDMVAGLGSDDRAAVIEASSRVIVRSPLTSDRAALASAIGEIQETDTAGNLADAILLAEQIAKAERDAGIIVIGDGGGSPFSSDQSPASSLTQASSSLAALRFVRVGQRANNAGIVALNSRPAGAGGRREVFASIANFSERERAIGLELRIDGKLVDARTVNLSANDRSGVIFDSLPQAGGLAELKLVVDDDLASDNMAYTFLPDARRMRVGVSSDNTFLLRALAVNPDLDARKIAPGAALSEFDCMVIEGPMPSGVLESNKPVLAINPSDVAGLWQQKDERENPGITSVDRSHPVNNYLSYADLHIESAPRRDTAAWLGPVVGSGTDGLIWAGEDGRRRIVLVGFDPAKSDLPLKVEFPILLANSISWLAGRDQVADERAARTGQPVTIATASANIDITTPAGDALAVEARDGSIVFADTMRAGVYEVKDSLPFAASLLSESESDTAPRDTIKTRRGEAGGQAETLYSEREVWRWIALAALALLAVEWWVYHRRITV